MGKATLEKIFDLVNTTIWEQAWYNNDDLNITTGWKDEWTNFIAELKKRHVRLIDQLDELF